MGTCVCEGGKGWMNGWLDVRLASMRTVEQNIFAFGV
jgi:hypothetical protein